MAQRKKDRESKRTPVPFLFSFRFFFFFFQNSHPLNGRSTERKHVLFNDAYCNVYVMKSTYYVCRYNYRCVIYGWDEKCVQSEDWIAQMRVDQHPPGRHQPFYNVLAHDGSNRYAAQG